MRTPSATSVRCTCTCTACGRRSRSTRRRPSFSRPCGVSATGSRRAGDGHCDRCCGRGDRLRGVPRGARRRTAARTLTAAPRQGGDRGARAREPRPQGRPRRERRGRPDRGVPRCSRRRDAGRAGGGGCARGVAHTAAREHIARPPHPDHIDRGLRRRPAAEPGRRTRALPCGDRREGRGTDAAHRRPLLLGAPRRG